MASTSQDGDRISLSKLDARILTSLLMGPQGGYEIARHVEIDSASEFEVSNGSIYPALSRLQGIGFIQRHGKPEAGPGKARLSYKITLLGREVLTWEKSSMERQITLIEERLASSKPTKKRP